jgi:hypothetical protein
MPDTVIERIVEPGWVKLYCANPYMSMICLLGPDTPKITAGGGGWEVTPRPRQIGMTTWNGVEPYQYQFSILLDGGTLGFKERASLDKGYGIHNWKSQEPAMRSLMAVWRGDGDSRPGIVVVEGLPDVPVRRWVIEDLDIADDAERRDSDMDRVRVVVTLTLREYQPPTYKKLMRHALQGPVGPRGLGGKTVVIKVKGGRGWDDTPAKIAKRRGCKWTDIRKLNPSKVKKANQKLKNGTKLRVPVMKKGRDEK